MDKDKDKDKEDIVLEKKEENIDNNESNSIEIDVDNIPEDKRAPLLMFFYSTKTILVILVTIFTFVGLMFDKISGELFSYISVALSFIWIIGKDFSISSLKNFFKK